MTQLGVGAAFLPVLTSAAPPASGLSGCVCPTCAQALNNAAITAEVTDAWNDSNAGNANLRHEEGGWVIMSLQQPCALRTSRVPAGERASLTPGADPSGANEIACGFFHTHPNPPVDEKGRKWDQGPSDADRNWHTARGLWGIVRNAAGNECF